MVGVAESFLMSYMTGCQWQTAWGHRVIACGPRKKKRALEMQSEWRSTLAFGKPQSHNGPQGNRDLRERERDVRDRQGTARVELVELLELLELVELGKTGQDSGCGWRVGLEKWFGECEEVLGSENPEQVGIVHVDGVCGR